MPPIRCVNRLMIFVGTMVALASLRKCADSPEPPLLAQTKSDVDEESDVSLDF